MNPNDINLNMMKAAVKNTSASAQGAGKNAARNVANAANLSALLSGKSAPPTPSEMNKSSGKIHIEEEATLIKRGNETKVFMPEKENIDPKIG